MQVKIKYHTSLVAKIIHLTLLTALWSFIFFLIALNVLFDWGIINDHLAPLYNLFNIEFTTSNELIFNVSIALSLIFLVAIARLSFLNFTGGKRDA
ncbi:hypothetical protein [Pediococcus stilesii]|uniref:Uncharacterized protein n=1 Tax=Pediococcus stilesii TaxID=331679 RepID=A0A5R9BQH7_9LACO|nr:hypothetical protein [Pediococcus stilesii]TLQ02839.1 hypothetical protein FEZ51_10260 [Pediococcus stilesii]